MFVLVITGSGCGSAAVTRRASTPTTSPSTSAPTSAPATHGALLSEVERDVTVTPEQVTISKLGVNATVVGVGLDPITGELAVPPDVEHVAFYRGGSLPGGAGGALLAAHVDFNGRRGLFLRLAELNVGDEITVRNSDGVVHRFAVVSVTRVAKDALPTAQLVAPGGPPRLSLVTCGGRFDSGTRHYSDNVVVSASPI